MASVSEELSYKFKNMAIVCAILVVFIHVRLGKVEAGSVLWWFSALIPQGISRIGVPFFFLASGYFLAGHIGESGWWKREVLKRIRTLLVPFIIWNALFLLEESGTSIVADLLAHRPFGTNALFIQHPELLLLGFYPLESPPLFVTWYIRSLFALFFVSPVIVWALRRFPRVFILGVWALSNLVVVCHWYEWSYLPRFTWDGVAYFSAGIFLRLHPIRVEGRGLWLGSGIIALVLLALRVGQAYTGKLAGIPFNVLFIPFLMYVVWGLIPATPWAKGLTSLAFACYLLHLFVIRVLGRVIPAVAGGVGVAPEVCAVVVPWSLIVLSVPVTLLLGYALHRLFPKVTGVLFGGR